MTPGDARAAGESLLLPLIAPAPRRTGRERRAALRLQVEVACEERAEGQRYIRYIHDLSAFGLSTRDGVNPPLGAALDLTLHLPDGPLSLRARVINRHHGSGGVRIRFSNPPREAVRRLSRFVAARARGPGEPALTRT